MITVTDVGVGIRVVDKGKALPCADNFGVMRSVMRVRISLPVFHALAMEFYSAYTVSCSDDPCQMSRSMLHRYTLYIIHVSK